MSWTTQAPVATSWSEPVAGSLSWTTNAGPSVESRLNPVYPLPENPAGDLDFVWRIQSTGFWIVATGNQVQIKSRITDGP